MTTLLFICTYIYSPTLINFCFRLSLFLSVSVSVSVCLYLFLTLSVSVSLYLILSLSICLSMSISVYLCLCVSVSTSLSRSVSLFLRFSFVLRYEIPKFNRECVTRSCCTRPHQESSVWGILQMFLYSGAVHHPRKPSLICELLICV